MSTLLVTTVSTSNGTVDLNLQTGNNTAGKISIPASGAAINVSANVIVNGTMNVYSSATVNGALTANGFNSIVAVNNWGLECETNANNSSGIWMESGGNAQLALRDNNANLATITTSGGTLTTSGNLTVGANLSVSTNTLTLGTSSISTSGYSRLPNGLLLQWGTVFVNQDSSASVTFPVAFTALYNISITAQTTLNTTTQGIDGVASQSTTGFTLNHGQDGNITFYWLAIGR